MPTPRVDTVHVLIGTPDETLHKHIAEKLTPSGFTCEHAADVRSFEARMSRGEHAAYLLDANWHPVAPIAAARTVSGPLVVLEADEADTTDVSLDTGTIEVIAFHPDMSGRSLAREVQAAIHHFRVQKRSEDELRQQRGLLQILLHNLPLLVASLDSAGRLLWANPELSRLLGYSVAELKTRPLFDVLVSEPAERGRIADGVERASGAWILSTVRTADGRTLEIAWMSAPLPASGLLVIGRDVTAQHALERHVAQTDKLDAMGRLAGGIAHDFNNVITVISGSAQMLADRAAADSTEHLEALEIARACESARALTGQLLTFSRADRQRPSIIDLNAAVRNLQPMIERLIGADVQMSFSLWPGRLPVCIDEGQVDQVLVNLAINARDALSGHGTITIETASVDIDAAAAGSRPGLRVGPYARLSCCDTGMGMSSDTRSRIFEPFFTTKPPGRGTGIGLATVLAIVKGAHGTIDVTSTPGEGTTFTILWPIERRRSVSARAAAVSAAPAAPHTTVLLIEDHAGIRAVCQRVLEREGHRVLVAGSGGEGLQVLRGHEDIGLVISDVRLGTGENGLAILDVVRRERPKTPLLLMSGQAPGPMPADVTFLEKPFTPAGLVAAVRSVMASPATP